MQETQVVSLGQEDPLEEEMATHSNILAWKNTMDRGACWATAGGGHKELDRTEHTHAHTDIFWMKEKGAHHKDMICMANSVLALHRHYLIQSSGSITK